MVRNVIRTLFPVTRVILSLNSYFHREADGNASCLIKEIQTTAQPWQVLLSWLQAAWTKAHFLNLHNLLNLGSTLSWEPKWWLTQAVLSLSHTQGIKGKKGVKGKAPTTKCPWAWCRRAENSILVSQRNAQHTDEQTSQWPGYVLDPWTNENGNPLLKPQQINKKSKGSAK